MKKIIILLVLTTILLSLTSCFPKVDILDKEENDKSSLPEETIPNNKDEDSYHQVTKDLILATGETIEERIVTPRGFTRIEARDNTFAQYLRTLPLKSHGSKVQYYDGRTKNQDFHAAVIDMDIGSRDLQQCADAIMRLRAEYFFKNQQYEKIHFNFTNGFRVDYTKWMQGNRIAVEGNNTYWVKRTDYSNTYESFRKYLDIIYTYAGTLSLEQELQQIEAEDLSIGDIIIQGGSPGHAVIVVDMAENANTGEKLFLIAQSYMPAQSIHILINPKDENLSPWYTLNFDGKLYTPEWTFTKEDFKRFN